MTKKQLRHWALWSAFLFGCVSALLGLGYYRAYSFPSDGLAQAFVALALPGHFIFICFLLVIPSLFISQLVPREKLLGASLITTFSAYLSILVVDLKTFELYRFHLNSMVFKLLTGGAAGDIFEFSAKDIVIATALLLGVILVTIFCVWASKKLAQRRRGLGWLACMSSLLVMFFGQLIYAWSDASIYQPVMRQLNVIPWAQPLTAKTFFEKRGWVNLEKNRVKVTMPGKGAMNYPKQGFSCAVNQKQERHNLLLIIIDTMRYDLLTSEVMPFTSSLAKTGVQYKNHFSTSNATRFGLFGLFYGLNGSYWHAALSESRPPVLLDQLKKQGYDFGVFASAKLTSPEFDRTIFAGVREDIYLSTPAKGKANRDIKANQRFLEFMESRKSAGNKSPFFGLLFYDAAHGYAYPQGFETRFTPVMENVSYAQLNKNTDPEPLLNRYKNSLLFIDGLIKKAIDKLRESGELGNTVIMITSDHGQEFNDSGGNYWGHNSSYSKWQTKVPMAIVTPGGVPESYSHLTSHIDVAPTLLKEVLKCEPELATYTQGRYMDSGKGHDFLMFNSWSRFGFYDTKNYVVMHNSGVTDVYDSNYQLLENAEPDQKLMLKAMKLNSEFLK